MGVVRKWFLRALVFTPADEKVEIGEAAFHAVEILPVHRSRHLKEWRSSKPIFMLPVIGVLTG